METNRQPFQDTIDTSIFYGGGARREIVDNIKAALADDVELLTLSGTDGSGKTMICRMVEQELQGNTEILFFEQGAESFDEVVNSIAAQVELEETDQSDRNTRLEQAVEILNQQDRRLLLILDGAEKIFLATLERIRRMLDQVNSSRLSIQLLISGRPLFSLNFKQLAIINFKEIKEQHFSLDPLDGRATHRYLNHCLDQLDTEEQKRFSLAQAEEIADIARGNFKLINQLARKLHDLKRLASEKGAAVDDDYGDDADMADPPPRPAAGLANVDLDFLKVPKIGMRWYAIGGVIVVLVLLIALFRGGGEEDTAEMIPGSEDVPDLTLENVEPDPIEIPEPSITVESLQPPTPGIAPEEPQPTVAENRPADRGPEPLEETQEPVVQELNETQSETAPELSTEVTEKIVEQAPATEPEPEPEIDTAQTDSQKVVVPPSGEEREEVARAVEPVAEEVEEDAALPSGQDVEIVTEAVEESVALQRTPVEEIATDPPGRDLIEEPAEIQQDSAATQNLTESLEEVETGPSDESDSVPQPTVRPKRIPATEPTLAEPTPTELTAAEVVTLREESKTLPNQLAESEPTVATAVPQRPDEEAQSSVMDTLEPEPTLSESQPEQVASIDRSEDEVVAPPVVGSTSPLQVKDSSVYYAQRLAAGSRWLVGGSRDKYTVQLMVLSSEDAQQNVRYMLSEKSYQPIMDRLYILRKAGQPQTVMLYWGEFDTPAEAREARNQLPSFLNRLEPFEIPVKDAVAKARAGQ